MKPLDYIESALFMFVATFGAGMCFGILIAYPVFSAIGVCGG